MTNSFPLPNIDINDGTVINMVHISQVVCLCYICPYLSSPRKENRWFCLRSVLLPYRSGKRGSLTASRTSGCLLLGHLANCG